jgi:hypothetical protein
MMATARAIMVAVWRLNLVHLPPQVEKVAMGFACEFTNLPAQFLDVLAQVAESPVRGQRLLESSADRPKPSLVLQARVVGADHRRNYLHEACQSSFSEAASHAVWPW